MHLKSVPNKSLSLSLSLSLSRVPEHFQSHPRHKHKRQKKCLKTKKNVISTKKMECTLNFSSATSISSSGTLSGWNCKKKKRNKKTENESENCFKSIAQWPKKRTKKEKVKKKQTARATVHHHACRKKEKQKTENVRATLQHCTLQYYMYYIGVLYSTIYTIQ